MRGTLREEAFRRCDRAAGEPGHTRQRPHLDMRRVGIVLRVLLAVVADPRTRLVLRLRAPATLAVDQKFVSTHRRRHTRRGALPSALPALQRDARAERGTASS